MPFSLFGSKKPAPPTKEEIAAEMTAKGMVLIKYQKPVPGQWGDYDTVEEWVTPEIAAEHKARQNAQNAKVKTNRNAYAAAEQARLLEEKKAARSKKLAECKAFVAQAEAEIAAEEAMTQQGGRRSTRRRRRFTTGPGLTVRRARKSKSRKA